MTATSARRIVDTYAYRDEAGALLFQVVRYEPKDFKQRTPGPNGPTDWTWKLNGVRRVLYRLPELLATPDFQWVFVVEGEKDADRLASLGLTATTNQGGAGNWGQVDPLTVRKAFADRPVAILPDNDDKGRSHATDVAQSVHAVANEVRIVTLPGLPEKGDVSDWLDSGGTVAKLMDLANASAVWCPPEQVSCQSTGTKPGQATTWNRGQKCLSDFDIAHGTPDQQGGFNYLSRLCTDGACTACHSARMAGRPVPDKPKDPSGYNPRLYSSAEFFKTDFRREFFVRNVLVRGQPGALGGGKKLLKSGVAIDLSISLDTATPFLGHDRFTVPKRANVMLLNGESGESTIQETAVRIAKARGIDPDQLQITWGADLPQLANADHLNELAAILEERKIEVLIVDPVYLCLLGGAGPGGEASNLFDMGAVYLRVAKTCLAVGCTPILVAHAKKNRTKEAPDLDDLAYAGIAEFARQWILLSRRELYEGDGLHKLWLNVGGSAGHSFLGHLDVDEGIMDDNFQGRKWETTVTPYNASLRERKSERDQTKADEKNADELTTMATIDKLIETDGVATQTKVRNGSGLSRPRTDSAIERLRLARLIEEYQASVQIGNNAKRLATAFRRKPE